MSPPARRARPAQRSQDHPIGPPVRAAGGAGAVKAGGAGRWVIPPDPSAARIGLPWQPCRPGRAEGPGAVGWPVRSVCRVIGWRRAGPSGPVGRRRRGSAGRHPKPDTLHRASSPCPERTPTLPLPEPYDVICLSLEPWNEVWRRNQLMVTELLRLRPEMRVLFAETPVDVLWSLRQGHRPTSSGLRPIASPAPLAMMPDRAVEPDVVEALLLGHLLARVLGLGRARTPPTRGDGRTRSRPGSPWRRGRGPCPRA